jgi:sugar (pentulose or hexulose) kinase
VGLYPLAERQAGVDRKLLVDPFLSPRGPWAAMMALTAIGVTIEKYLDRFLLQPGEDPAAKYELFNELAGRSPAGAGGLRLDLYRDPHDFLKEVRDPLGGHPREHLARALMEGAALVTKRRLEELAAAGIRARRLVMVGGPAESPVWPRIVAEICGLELSLRAGQAAGALGAAMLAAIGAGLFADEREAFAAMGGQAVVLRPEPEAVRRYEEIGAD